MKTDERKHGVAQVFVGVIKCFASAFLFIFIGCGGGAPEKSDNNSSEVKKETPAAKEDEDKAGRISLDENPDVAPVLVEMNGVLYQVFEIAEGPYSGKKVEKYPGGMEKRETMYSEGKLTRVTEFHQSGQKKMEVKVDANGQWKRLYWDNNGNPTQRAPIGALGRTRNWTYSVNQQSIDIAYRGVAVAVIRKGFGEPDDEQNGFWIYRAMRVQTVDGLKTTVKFLIRNGIVFQVLVEP